MMTPAERETLLSPRDRWRFAKREVRLERLARWDWEDGEAGFDRRQFLVLTRPLRRALTIYLAPRLPS